MSGTNFTLPNDIFDISPYHYVPTQSITILFLVLFGLSAGQAVWYKIWWLLPTAVLAGVGETIGWAGRYWSSRNVPNGDAFRIQIVCTIISPTPLLAASFIILSRLTSILGTQYSRLSPRWYSRIFLTCDIIALIIQALGGGLADSDDASQSRLGSNIMLGGIVFQLVALVIFATLMVEYFVRCWRNLPREGAMTSPYGSSTTLVRQPREILKLKLASAALCFSTLVLFIRSVYRTAELADGWNGRIIATQVYFNVLDGGMVVLAIYTLNFVHPGLWLGLAPRTEDKLVEGAEMSNLTDSRA
ncbi:RTA1-domain-containing protein [Trametopsis cervina]|nr:RTA1-domain-containing protein [Trametopsis cervina]